MIIKAKIPMSPIFKTYEQTLYYITTIEEAVAHVSWSVLDYPIKSFLLQVSTDG